MEVSVTRPSRSIACCGPSFERVTANNRDGHSHTREHFSRLIAGALAERKTRAGVGQNRRERDAAPCAVRSRLGGINPLRLARFPAALQRNTWPSLAASPSTV